MTGTRSKRCSPGPAPTAFRRPSVMPARRARAKFLSFILPMSFNIGSTKWTPLCGHSSCLCPSSSAWPSLHFSENQPVPRKANIDVSLQDHAP
jgi:hypothetical protein